MVLLCSALFILNFHSDEFTDLDLVIMGSFFLTFKQYLWVVVDPDTSNAMFPMLATNTVNIVTIFMLWFLIKASDIDTTFDHYQFLTKETNLHEEIHFQWHLFLTAWDPWCNIQNTQFWCDSWPSFIILVKLQINLTDAYDLQLFQIPAMTREPVV